MSTAATLRRKLLWTAADFAAFLGDDVSPRQARALLKRWDVEAGGTLLMMSMGKNRLFRFAPSKLKKLHPEIFERIESLEGRVDELEETVSEMKAHQKRVVSQVGQNTRDIAKQSQQLQLFKKAG